MTKLSVDLGPVQETLLIPLLGRARETQTDSGLIQDNKAVEIVNTLDYDFSKWRNEVESSWCAVVNSFERSVIDLSLILPYIAHTNDAPAHKPIADS